MSFVAELEPRSLWGHVDAILQKLVREIGNPATSSHDVATAHSTASPTLEDSTTAPSPLILSMRPLLSGFGASTRQTALAAITCVWMLP